MHRLVQPKLAATGQSNRGDEPEAFVADRPGDVDSLRFQIGDGGVDVIAHEVELVLASFVGRMGRQLRGRQGEDQPAAAGIDGRELEHVSEERAIPLCVPSEDDCVHASDHVRTPVLYIGRGDQYSVPATTIARNATPDSDRITAALARNVRSLRQARGWTLTALAARSGVSKGMVVELEQGRTNPSIVTVDRLATAFGVGLAQLVEVGDEPELRIVTGDEAVRLWSGAEGGWGAFLVGTQQPAQTELWAWTLEPGDAYEGQIHPAGSRELLYVLEGEITLVLDHRQRTALAQHAAGLYTADRPNRIENGGAVPARVIMVFVGGGGSR
jgi:transcriptional regulator with XRE-family HTH domain